MPRISEAERTAKPLAGECANANAPMQDVENKVAFITGGSSGIGLGIARAFIEAGMRVVLTYRKPAHRDEAMNYFKDAQDRVHCISVDVTDRPGMERAADETVDVFGKVHVLVNNAGVVIAETLSRTNYKDWDWLMNVNLNGVFNGIQAFLPHIRNHGDGGQIVTTSSMMGLLVATGGGLGAYAASKFAVVGLMEALRAELAGTNIGASVICPGMVRSNIWASSRGAHPLSSADTKSEVEAIERKNKQQNDPEFAMDPLEVGRLVLHGVRNNDLYILTHPEYRHYLRERSEALEVSIPADLHPTKSREGMARLGAKRSIYSIEKDRKRCIRKRG